MAKKKSTQRKSRTQKQFIASIPNNMRPPSWMPNPEDKSIKVIKQKFVHDWLFRKWTLTSADAWRKFGMTRLADIIWKMRKKGVHINTALVKGVDRFGNKVQYAKYRYISGKRHFLKVHKYAA